MRETSRWLTTNGSRSMNNENETTEYTSTTTGTFYRLEKAPDGSMIRRQLTPEEIEGFKIDEEWLDTYTKRKNWSNLYFVLFLVAFFGFIAFLIITNR